MDNSDRKTNKERNISHGHRARGTSDSVDIQPCSLSTPVRVRFRPRARPRVSCTALLTRIHGTICSLSRSVKGNYRISPVGTRAISVAMLVSFVLVVCLFLQDHGQRECVSCHRNTRGPTTANDHPNTRTEYVSDMSEIDNISKQEPRAPAIDFHEVATRQAIV